MNMTNEEIKLTEPAQPEAETITADSIYYSQKSGLTDPLRLYEVSPTKFTFQGRGRLCTKKHTTIKSGYKVANQDIFVRTGTATVTVNWDATDEATQAQNTCGVLFINRHTAEVEYAIHIFPKRGKYTYQISVDCDKDYLVYPAVVYDYNLPHTQLGVADYTLIYSQNDIMYDFYIIGIPFALNNASQRRLYTDLASPELSWEEHYFCETLTDLAPGDSITIDITGEQPAQMSNMIAHFDYEKYKTDWIEFYSPIPLESVFTNNEVAFNKYNTEKGTYKKDDTFNIEVIPAQNEIFSKVHVETITQESYDRIDRLAITKGLSRNDARVIIPYFYKKTK